jgi:hypothetical protein
MRRGRWRFDAYANADSHADADPYADTNAHADQPVPEL